MTTLSILIGNSDDKLKQSAWSEYIVSVQTLIADLDYTVHFHGFSQGDAPWQNACWVIEGSDDFGVLYQRLKIIAWAFHQDSIALVLGETHFLKPEDRNG